jgi:tellurite resistance protein TehA-like permease
MRHSADEDGVDRSQTWHWYGVSTRLARCDEQLEGMSSSSFVVVMATGIVSIGARLLNVALVDSALLFVNVVVYVALWLLTALRLVRHPWAIVRELGDHQRGTGVLAIVAATCVLGAQMILIANSLAIATALLIIGAVLWLVLHYALFVALTIKPEKPSLADGMNGGWLLAVVATESVAVLLALLSTHWHKPLRLDADFVALSMWLWGGMLYVWIVSLIVYRYAFVRFSPADMTPSYWINVGAMAISVLAGSLLADRASAAPLLESLRPFVEGTTVLFWATGTWWIPMIVLLTAWRHVVGGVPVRYDPLYWSAVFPLGMYAVATREMAGEMSLDFLDVIPRVIFWIALVAWLLAFVGMARRLLSRVVGVARAATAHTER